ncbi:glutathione-dependent formaldehyde-activating enzyme [Colletotrichum incanum]|nr:glutathione-dependent formaldehyde-activating enzyme [Colletotrichum incanum]
MIALDSSGGIEPYAGSLCSVENASTAQPTKFLGTLPDVTGDDLKFYTGGCDCGVVQIAVGTKSLYDADIKEDNCSICIRNSFIGFYPHKSQVTLVGNDQTQDYKFGREFNGSPFCRICGVHCFGNLYGPPKEILDRLSEARREFVRKQLEVQPLNIRVLDDVEWDRINITWSNDGTEGYILPE